jgi:hypothetical protein
MDKRRQQSCVAKQAKLRVSAPRRSQLIGSTLASRGARFTVAHDGRRGDPWPHNQAESGNVGLEVREAKHRRSL